MPKDVSSESPSRGISQEGPNDRSPNPPAPPVKTSSAISREQSNNLPADVTLITPAARAIIDTLRERFPELQPSSPLYARFDDAYLNRFVRARRYRLEDVIIMVRDHLKWFEEFGVADIMNFDFTELDQFRVVYPHGYHGQDKLGRPLYIERYSKLNADFLYKVTSMERVSKYWVKGYEQLLFQRLPACSKEGEKPVTQSCVILDLAGVKLSMFDSRAREFLKTVSKISSDNYPETLGAMFVVNVPSFFSIVYSVAKPLIPADTKKKIHVVTAKHTKEELLKFIDAANIPHFLGGDCVCDPRSDTDDKGCLRSDRGPWRVEKLVSKHSDEDFVSIHDGEIYDSRSFISAGDQSLSAPEQQTMDGSHNNRASGSRKRGLCSSFCCH